MHFPLLTGCSLVSIGTPGQNVKVAIDTGSDELWVNPDCTSEGLSAAQVRECNSYNQYDPNQSSTAEVSDFTNQISYGKGEVEITYVTDNIALPESTINVTSAQFGVATASSELNEGILGLGFGKGFNLQYNNFVDMLAVDKQTNSRAFSVALGSVKANNGGVLIFGGVDTKKFSGPLISNPILGPQNGEPINRYWIQMTGIGYSKSGGSSATQYSGSAMPIVIDSGSSLSYLPASIVSSMASDLKGSLDRASGLYTVPCDQAKGKGSMDFSFGQVTIKVPLNEFIWQYSDSLCVLGASPLSGGGGVTPLLGDTFMRSAFVVFDQSSETISMAQYANCGENEQAIPASGAGNFTGECAGAAADKSAGGRVTFSMAGLAVAAVAGLAVAL
jgi:hypothetical protein